MESDGFNRPGPDGAAKDYAAASAPGLTRRARIEAAVAGVRLVGRRRQTAPSGA